jgi:uncharacterized protein (TIGR02246 family)
VELSGAEGRVLGALVEKELTTPQGYPLTDNALVAACNQTTSRDPVVSYDVGSVRVAVRSLREQGLLRTLHRTGERSDKHRHELPSGLDLSLEQVAVLAVLLLRGPQTAAEVRVRAERMHPFASSDEVERVLAELAARSEPLAVRLERQPGRKEARWAQLLAEGGTGGTAAAAAVAPAPTADPPAAVVDALLRSLVDALRARDVDAALDLFAEDAVLLGSDSGERAEGHDELRALLGRFFEQPATTGWEWERLAADRASGVLWFLVEGDAVLQGDVEQRRPYRISGVVVPRDGRAVLVQFHGSEPAATCVRRSGASAR